MSELTLVDPVGVNVTGKTTMLAISQGASVTELVQRAKLIDEVYRRIMKKDVHYGVIPGTFGKPSLLKPGAEKLLSLFNLGATDPIIKERELPEGHREYLLTVNIIHYPSSRLVGTGVGLCSTMEKKYRYRNAADYEVTDEVIPRDAKEKKKEYREKGYGMKKVEGEWVWVKYGDSEASENPDIADMYNTVLKMAHKRALVAGALVVTGASDIFTQDIEDFADIGQPLPPVPQATETKKYTVKEGSDVWENLTCKDVVEKKLPDGKTYYIIYFNEDDKSAGTITKELAERCAAFGDGDILKAFVHPGRKPNSWVLDKIESSEDPGAGSVAAVR